MTQPKKCIGFPVGKPCDNESGYWKGPHWCEECNKKRFAHIDNQLNQMQKEVTND